MSDSESEIEAPKVVKKEKKKCSEAQLANLRKGMEVMKQKREALAKQRVEIEEKKKKGASSANERVLDSRPKLIRGPRWLSVER
jgi:hypothetical protein